jgi:hypothetical protein
VTSPSAAAKPRHNRAARCLPEAASDIDPVRARHLALGSREIVTAAGRIVVTVDDGESPLAWLARRKSGDGAPLIDAAQFESGERLRADFTFAQLMPRTTSDWNAAAASGRGGPGGGAAGMTDAVVAARQRVRHALEAVGPEFAGVLVDVCCFLKGLEQVERERRWPSRSAKVVLQLGLDSLARHYGYRREIRGAAQQPVRGWRAEELPEIGE